MQSDPPRSAAADDLAPGEVDFAAIFRALRAGWRTIALCVVLAMVGAVVYLNIVPYRYSVEMRVAPVTAADSASSKLSQLGGLATVAGLALPDTGGSGSFKLYVEAMHSRDVADVLVRDPTILHGVFARQWDARTETWLQPQGIVHDVAAIIKPILGIPIRPFAPPGAAALQAWMTEQVSIDQNLKTPVVTVTMMSDEPAFSVRFLDRLAVAIDTLLRQRALLRTDDYIRYLSMRLPTITLAEQRIAIAAALGEQERMKMVASSNRPYAADVFEHPAASERPVSPVPIRILGIALILGAGVGIAMVFMRRQTPRRMLTSEL